MQWGAGTVGCNSSSSALPSLPAAGLHFAFLPAAPAPAHAPAAAAAVRLSGCQVAATVTPCFSHFHSLSSLHNEEGKRGTHLPQCPL